MHVAYRESDIYELFFLAQDRGTRFPLRSTVLPIFELVAGKGVSAFSPVSAWASE